MNDSGKIKLALIFGGQSLEHEVSLMSARSVLAGLDAERFDVVLAGIDKNGGWHVYDCPRQRIAEGELDKALVEALRLGGGNGASADSVAAASADPAAAVSAAPVATASADPAAAVSAAPAAAEADIAPVAGGALPKAGRPIGDMCGGATIQALAAEGVDVFFPVLHGRLGEDGAMQGLLEMAGAAYVGCGVFASAACMDKSMAKIILGAAGIPQARHIACRAGDLEDPALGGLLDEIEAALGFPCFVKPSSSGSSVGVSKCGSRPALVAALRGAAQFDDKILVEEFVEGREFECSVLGGDSPQTSVVGEIVPGAEFYDYDAKYASETSRTIIPADLPDGVSGRMRELAAAAFAAMGCAGLARVDFFVRARDGSVVLNEINTMPGFTQISMYPKLWEASGLPFPRLLERLVELALERKRRDGRLVKTLEARPGGGPVADS
jgi:D-alanine-D-alanine ligase